MNPSILSLLPPLITIICALATQAIFPSLLLGILSATLLISNGDPIEAIQLVFKKVEGALVLQHGFSLQTIQESSALSIFIFLLCLGCIISLVSHSGGAYAYAQTKTDKNLSQTRASTDTIILALFLCIDDYFSTITVGSVMKTITDHAKIPRIKLAFIITSLSTTLCAIVPFSSWGAEIIFQFINVGISRTSPKLLYAEPMYVFFLVVPCVLQAWSSIANLLTYIFTPIYFGPFHRHNVIAQKTNNLWGGKESPQASISPTPERNKQSASQFDFFIPIFMLILFLLIGIFYTGNLFLFGGTSSLMEAVKTAKISQSLAFSGLTTLMITTTLLFFRSKLEAQELPSLIREGCLMMITTIFMLSAAWTLSYIVSNDLQTGVFLANNFPASISPIFLPVIVYLMAIGTTIGIGSAWASIALLLSIVLPLTIQLLGLTAPILPEAAPLVFVVIGSIISGSLMGNQISPIADVTVMASSSAGAHHIDFMQAQFLYTVPQILSVSFSYFLLGWTSVHATTWYEWTVMISIIAGIILLFPQMYIVIQNRRYRPEA